MAEADLRRLGEKANLLARWHLKKDQEDLQRKKPKLRQLVIDFPEEIKNLSMPIKPSPIVAERTTSHRWLYSILFNGDLR